MTTLELKGEIVEQLAGLKDTEALQKILQFISKVRKRSVPEQEVDDWDGEMPHELEVDLVLALEEIENPENLISAEEAERRLAKWRL